MSWRVGIGGMHYLQGWWFRVKKDRRTRVTGAQDEELFLKVIAYQGPPSPAQIKLCNWPVALTSHLSGKNKPSSLVKMAASGPLWIVVEISSFAFQRYYILWPLLPFLPSPHLTTAFPNHRWVGFPPPSLDSGCSSIQSPPMTLFRLFPWPEMACNSFSICWDPVPPLQLQTPSLPRSLCWPLQYGQTIPFFDHQPHAQSWHAFWWKQSTCCHFYTDASPPQNGRSAKTRNKNHLNLCREEHGETEDVPKKTVYYTKVKSQEWLLLLALLRIQLQAIGWMCPLFSSMFTPQYWLSYISFWER